jgi:hypothetical protein
METDVENIKNTIEELHMVKNLLVDTRFGSRAWLLTPF